MHDSSEDRGSASISRPTSKLDFRVARFSELYECSQVLGKAFYDDVLFGRYIHPYRDQYPDDMALYWYRPMQSEYWDWAMCIYVATETDEDGREVIAGVAHWHRSGMSARRCGWALPVWDPRTLLPTLSHISSTIASHINPNRAISPTEHDVLQRADPFTSHIFHGHRSEHWYLHFIGVHPDHQRKGIGRRLVKWGLDQARRENVAACVVAGYLKDVFYRRCGFRECLGRSGQGEGNPIGHIPGGNIWWVGPEVLREEGEEGGDGKVADDAIAKIDRSVDVEVDERLSDVIP